MGNIPVSIFLGFIFLSFFSRYFSLFFILNDLLYLIHTGIINRRKTNVLHCYKSERKSIKKPTRDLCAQETDKNINKILYKIMMS